jgi:hypothetical protein
MDETEATNRSRKLESRVRARRHSTAGRGYLHAMTNSRVRRVDAILKNAEERRKPSPTSDTPPASREPGDRKRSHAEE